MRDRYRPTLITLMVMRPRYVPVVIGVAADLFCLTGRHIAITPAGLLPLVPSRRTVGIVRDATIVVAVMVSFRVAVIAITVPLVLFALMAKPSLALFAIMPFMTLAIVPITVLVLSFLLIVVVVFCKCGGG
jgi:hypothetical protein